MRSDRADSLLAGLRGSGIEARSYYRTPIHRQPALAADVELPATEVAAATNLALPIGPGITATQITDVVAAVAAALDSELVGR